MEQIYWPGLVVGMLVGVYWGRVIRLVLKARRRTGRAANLVPPEPLGRTLRIIWFPVVVIWVGHPVVSAFVLKPPAPLRRLYEWPAIEWVAVAFVAAAFVATLFCWRRMGRSWRMGIDPAERTPLVFTGPYGFVRHPIYALSSAMVLSTLAAVPSALMALTAAAHLILLQWEARREERVLSQLHQDEYGRYMKHVGRFVPRSWKPYATPSAGRAADT